MVDELGSDVILGCQYTDAAVNEINIKKRAFSLKIGALVPIQKRCTRPQSAVPLLERHELKQGVKKSMAIVRVVKNTVITMNT